jgi:hypothetical protein
MVIMTTKQRFRNKYRLQLREKDHHPMHVHLVAGELNVRIDLLTLGIVSGHMPDSLWIEVRDWLNEHRTQLVKEWKAWQR